MDVLVVSPAEGARPRSVDGRGLDQAAGAAIRKRAVERVAQGERPSDVMRRYGLCRTTIYRWLRAANVGGPKALEPRPHRGRAPRVSVADAARIRSTLVDSSPREHGLPGDLWTRRTVCALVERQTHVVIHPVSASRLLGRLGMRPNGVSMPASEAAETKGPALALAVDGRGAFLCTRLEARESVDARRHKLRDLVRRAGRPTSVQVVPDPSAGHASGA